MLQLKFQYFGHLTQRTDSFVKSLLQLHSSKASILQCSAFFMVQFSDPYLPGAPQDEAGLPRKFET